MNLKLKIKPYKLQLKYPFTTSRYTVNVQETVIVSISDGTYVGYGETTTNPYYKSTLKKIEKSVNIVKAIVERGFGLDPGKLWQRACHPDLHQGLQSHQGTLLRCENIHRSRRVETHGSGWYDDGGSGRNSHRDYG